MTTPLRSQILSTISIYDQLPRPDLVRIVASHDLTTSHELIEFAMDMLVEEGALGMQLGVSRWEDQFFHIETKDAPMTRLQWLWLDYAAFRYRLRMFCSRVLRFISFGRWH